jgi:DMSO reductase family type II enzyme heme b subunit
MKTMTAKLLFGSAIASLFFGACGAEVEMKKSAPVADASFGTKEAVVSKSVTAQKIDKPLLGISPDSGLWNDAVFSEVVLYPQTSLTFSDKDAKEMNEKNRAKKAKVAALYNDKEVALAIIWKDRTENVHNGHCLDTYADGVAFQLAADSKNMKKLPYIGMGSKGREVLIYLQKVQFNNFEANGKGDVAHQVNRHQTNTYNDHSLYQKNSTKSENHSTLKKFDKKVASLGSDDYERKFVAAGYRSMTEIRDNDRSDVKISRIKGYGWIATLSRPIKDAYADLSLAMPVAFAVWDGGKLNRDGMKLLSGWTAVTLGVENKELVDVVNDTLPQADIKNGQIEAITNCAGCHVFPGAKPASIYMAPDLSNIGGYATAAYIRESMLKPHAVVVAGYNRNAHSNYMWYTLNGETRESTMPAFDYLDTKTLNDITAYFKTLKVKAE